MKGFDEFRNGWPGFCAFSFTLDEDQGNERNTREHKGLGETVEQPLYEHLLSKRSGIRILRCPNILRVIRARIFFVTLIWN